MPKTPKVAAVVEVEKEEEPRKTYIKLPDGFEVPAEVEDGKNFEAVVEIKKDDDGKFCIVSIDGIPLKEDEEDEDEREEAQSETIGAGARRMMEGDY